MTPTSDLEQEIDRLYALPLEEFTAARNESAKQMKVSGGGAAAARVKALPKPSVSAWAVNQLHHRAGEDLERLYQAGDRLREVQTGAAGPQAHRVAVHKRRDVVNALTEQAAGYLEEAGQPATDATRQRLTRTLEALAAYPRGALSDPGPGRLAGDLEPPGFEALAGLTVQAPARAPARRKVSEPPAPVTPRSSKRPTKRQVADAEKSLQAAKDSLAQARAEAKKARTAQQRTEKLLAKAEDEAAAADEQARSRRRRADELAITVRALGHEVQQAEAAASGFEQTMTAAKDRLAELNATAKQ